MQGFNISSSAERGGRKGPLAAIITIFLLMASTPALANHKAPFSGSSHEYGEMVEYDLVFPVAGDNTYSNGFWASRGSGTHHAVDIMANKMTPVVAAHDGKIVRYNGSSNPDYKGKCCTLAIRHTDDWESVYIHLNNDTPGTDDGQGWGIAPHIQLGSQVKAGEVIGWVGDSGNAEGTAPHLHFELIDPEGVYVNPYAALSGSPVVSSSCPSTDSVSLDALFETSGLLKQGARGTAVKQLQDFLNALGYQAGPADGVMGPLTVGAVRSFQEGRGLNPDGVVGPATRAEVRMVAAAIPALPVLEPGTPTIRPGDRGEDVQRLQQLLEIAGFSTGGADGVFGPNTEHALSDFQKSYGGLTVDGKYGPNTRSALAAFLGLGNLQTCG